jgi:lipopolysaccharide assembly outer membrane protein LptD (OstA)
MTKRATLHARRRSSPRWRDAGRPTRPRQGHAAAAARADEHHREELVYEDGKHRATYTGSVHMSGPDGDVTAERLELYLAEQGGELERAEADGNVVSRQEQRRAYGTHLTYTAKTEEYRMVGAPVKVYKDTAPDCSVTEGAVAT